MIYTVTLNPAVDKTAICPNFTIGKVNRIVSFQKDAAGKGINVSKSIKGLGGTSFVFAILGGASGEFIRQGVADLGIDADYVFVDAETRTNVKIIDPELHTNTDINEPGAPLTEEVQEQLLSKMLARVQPGDEVVLAGKAPQGAKNDIYYRWTLALKEKGVRVFLDADGDAMIEGIKAKPFLIKPNDDELARITGKTFTCVEDMIAAAKELQASGIERVVVTLGGDGALYLDGEKVIRAYGLKVPVGSTVGAGDSVVAALAYGMAQDMKLEDIVVLSTATGAATVMSSGTVAADYATIESLMSKVKYEIVK